MAAAPNTIAFESVDGPPPQIFAQFVDTLNAEARTHQLTMMPHGAPAQYHVRGYLSAQIVKKQTQIAWVWDVYDVNQQRALRMSGEEAAGKPGRDAWSAANPQVLRRIAASGMTQLAGFIASPQTSAPPPAPAPAAEPPAAPAVPAGTSQAVAFAEPRT